MATGVFPSSHHHMRSHLSSQNLQWGPRSLCIESWGYCSRSCLAKNRMSCACGSGTYIEYSVKGSTWGPATQWPQLEDEHQCQKRHSGHLTPCLYTVLYTFSKRNYLIITKDPSHFPDLDPVYLFSLIFVIPYLAHPLFVWVFLPFSSVSQTLFKSHRAFTYVLPFT